MVGPNGGQAPSTKVGTYRVFHERVAYAALARWGVGHGRQPGKTARRQSWLLPWRGRPGLAARGGGRHRCFTLCRDRAATYRPTPHHATAAAAARAIRAAAWSVGFANDRSRRDTRQWTKHGAATPARAKPGPSAMAVNDERRRRVLPRRASCLRNRCSRRLRDRPM